MGIEVPVIAGFTSTILFAISTLPMLARAYRTKDLHSYSIGNILIANGGNLVHSVYVYSLPAGPIWLLHTFHLITTGLMLGWYLRYEGHPDLRWPGTSGGTRRPPSIGRIPRSTPPSGA